jgi:hypothetical protein
MDGVIGSSGDKQDILHKQVAVANPKQTWLQHQNYNSIVPTTWSTNYKIILPNTAKVLIDEDAMKNRQEMS